MNNPTLGTCCRGSRAARSDYLQYCNSKVFLLMFTAELQKRLRAVGSSIDVFAAHPGVALTDAYRLVNCPASLPALYSKDVLYLLHL